MILKETSVPSRADSGIGMWKLKQQEQQQEQELTLRSIVRLLIAESVIVAVATALISCAYIFMLPRYFDDRRTYSVLVLGLAIAAAASGYVARRESWNWLLTIAISGIATVATLLLSLLFILNSRGS